MNLYAYVGNNPINRTDPDGLCSTSSNANAYTQCQVTANLTTSDYGKRFMTNNEGGVHLTVYNDTAKNPTVGVGHKVATGDNLKVGDVIDNPRSDSFFNSDLRVAERGVKSLVGNLPLSQNEFDALVDLNYNVGIGTLKNKSPALNAAIRNGDYNAMGVNLTYTRDSAGNRQGGLITRSNDRTTLFNSPK